MFQGNFGTYRNGMMVISQRVRNFDFQGLILKTKHALINFQIFTSKVEKFGPEEVLQIASQIPGKI